MQTQADNSDPRFALFDFIYGCIRFPLVGGVISHDFMENTCSVTFDLYSTTQC